MDAEEKKLYYETVSKIEDANNLEECLKDPKWEIIQRMFVRTVRDAQQKLNGEPLDSEESRRRAIRWQLMIDQYENVIPNLIERYRAIGKSAYETAEEKGWVNRVMQFFSKEI